MAKRTISASAAPYDGYDRDVMMESLARLGFSHVEPAFIEGYTEPFDESTFTVAHAMEWRASMSGAGIGCYAMSSHIDLSTETSVAVFANRMTFAAELGARVIISNAGPAARRAQFMENIEVLLRHAEELDISIALENPGDGSDSILNLAADGLALIEKIGSDRLGLNYDAANTASHRPELADFAADGIAALPASIHAHIKDVVRSDSGWHFSPIGEGIVGCGSLLHSLRDWPNMPVSIELPLRLSRDPNARPIRRSEKVDLLTIESALAKSLEMVRKALDQ